MIYIQNLKNNLTERLYQFSNDLIHSKETVKKYKNTIPQLDLFKIKHYDNKNKSTGLKWLMYHYDWHNIEEMPIHHSSEIHTIEQINQILDYNLNDVEFTLFFLKQCKDDIELRTDLQRRYGINCFNWSDSKIGEELVIRDYAKRTNESYWDIKEKKSYDNFCTYTDVISPKIKYESKELNLFLQSLLQNKKNLVTEDLTKDIFFNNTPYTFAKGGLHSNLKTRLFESTNTHKLIDLDFGSYYPSLMIELGIYPPQLGIEILNTLRYIRENRFAAKANKEIHIAESLKFALNSVFGKLGDEYSSLKDYKSFYTVTVNGQLFLLMLIEKLSKVGNQCFYANTDGASFIVPNKNEEKFYEICKQFQKEILDIPLEFANFKKAYIRDVNNYLIIKDDGKVKTKGDFTLPKDILPHKNKSRGIIPIAIYEYFVNNIPIEQTIKNHTNIYDFTIGLKLKGAAKRGEASYQIKKVINGVIITEELQSTIRYIVTQTGAHLTKNYEDGENKCEAHPIKGQSYKVTIINNMKDVIIPEINYQYYIRKAREIVDLFQDKPNLFNN